MIVTCHVLAGAANMNCALTARIVSAQFTEVMMPHRNEPPEPRQTPNPGSDEAIRFGCKCAVLDNNHGKFPPFPPDGWWMTSGCPVHMPNEAGPA